MESKSISSINSIHDFLTFSGFCSHPLFSTVVTLYTLILLYAPSFFLRVVLSPILNSTGIILLFLLKLGANEGSGKDLSENDRPEKESSYLEDSVVLNHKDKHYGQSLKDGDNLTFNSCFVLESTSLEQRFVDCLDNNHANSKLEGRVEFGFGSNQTSMEFKPDSSLELESNQINVELERNIGSECNLQDDSYKRELLDTNSMKSPQVVEKGETRMKMDSIQVDTTMKLLEWNLKVPLEIIYELYEGEEDNDSNENNMDYIDKLVMGCARYPSLSVHHPEIETDSSSDDDFPVNEKWEREERVFFKWEMEDDERDELIEISLDHYGKRSIEFCQDEEDSLIERYTFSHKKLDSKIT